MGSRKFDRFEKFHRLIPVLVQRFNEDEELAARAMANPILAIEELGYELTPAVRREVGWRIRFPGKQVDRLRKLSEKIFAEAGTEFDPESEKEVSKVLFQRLKLARPEKVEAAGPRRRGPPRPISLSAKRREPARTKSAKRKTAGTAVTTQGAPWVDPLQSMETAHAVMKPLLEYRALAVSRPGFATRAEYEDLKEGRRKRPGVKIKIRMPEGGLHHEENSDA